MPAFYPRTWLRHVLADLGVVGGSLTVCMGHQGEVQAFDWSCRQGCWAENGRSICGIEGAGTQSWWDSGGISKSQMCKHTPMHGTQRPGRCLDGSECKSLSLMAEGAGHMEQVPEQKG